MPAEDVLAGSPLYGVASSATRQRLSSSSVVRHFDRGTFVFHEGDAGVASYVVIDGRLKLTTSTLGGDELVLTTLGPGEAFGELAALDGGPRSAAAMTLADADVLVIPAEALREAVTGDPVLAEAFLSTMAALIRRSNERRVDLLFLDVSGRLAKHLLERATDDVTLDVDQSDLARMVGTSRQSLNATIRAFHREGVIEVNGRHILIRDPARLSAMSCQPDDSQQGSSARS